MRLVPLPRRAGLPLRVLAVSQTARLPSQGFARVLIQTVQSGSFGVVHSAARPTNVRSSMALAMKTHGRPPIPDQIAVVQQAAAPPSSIAVDSYGRMVVATARRLGVDPLLSLAIARAESGLSAVTAPEIRLDPRAVSADGGSVGLFQLTAATGKAQLQRTGLRREYQPFDPQQNADLGIGYVKYLFGLFSRETALGHDLLTTPGADGHETRLLAIAAYNAGEGRVARAQARARSRGGDPARYRDVAPYLPASTRQYVERVEHFAARLRTEALGLCEGGVPKGLRARATRPGENNGRVQGSSAAF